MIQAMNRLRPKKKAAPKRVFLAMPTKDGLTTRSAIALFDLLLKNGNGRYHFEWALSSTGSIAICRDVLVHHFLNFPDCSEFLTLDADMKWTPEHIHRLLDWDFPIVGATYARKEAPSRWVIKGIPGAERDPETGLLEVEWIGAGALKIRREVFEKMKTWRGAPEIEYDAPQPDGSTIPQWNFWPQGVFGRVFHGEDQGFCYIARKLGYKIMADTKLIIPHTGNADYPLPLFNDCRSPGETKAPTPAQD